MSKPCWILVFLLNFHQYRSQVMEGRANWPSLPEEEIEGGEIAEPNAFPFMVSIHKTSGKKTWHSCGGTIINKNSILTAGHCVWDKKKDEPLSEDVFTVVVGTNDIKHVENNLKIGVKKVFVHPAYSNIVQENDIAVLKTSKNIEFSLTTSSVTLAEKAMYVDSEPAAYFSNIMCVAPGWGLIVDNLSKERPKRGIHFLTTFFFRRLRDELDVSSRYGRLVEQPMHGICGTGFEEEFCAEF